MSDSSPYKFIFFLSTLYGLISILVHSILYMNHIKPLDHHAPLDQFSEARAVDHVRFLSENIDGRQEGRPGLIEAAQYINAQLRLVKDRAGSTLRVEVEETTVNGSFNMMFLGHSISIGYRNHTNIVMRISSIHSQDNETSILVNGHFDGPLGSPGAGDCGSCVASMLEIARLIVDSSWVPPKPVIFLFNGAEELFMLGSHGFMTTHTWRNTIGAFINIEASGTGGPDLVCQSGPGSWPSLIYAKSAVYPMANSIAQDIFPAIPGDTDYRIFAHDFGNIPGLDIIYMFGGYFYHTSYDTVERLIPGSMQARGDNLFNLIKAFASSSKLLSANEEEDERAVFFDFLSWFMIFYPKRAALILHCIPTAIFLLVPFLFRLPKLGLSSCFSTLCDFMKGMLLHTIGIILGVIVPVTFSILRLLFSNQAMNWFAHPYLAFLMFIPCSLVGLLIPRIASSPFSFSQGALILETSKEVRADEARFWGAFGSYAFLTLINLVAGLSGGFLTFFFSASMLLAWIFRLSVMSYGHQSLKPTLCYIVPLIPFLTYSVYFGGFIVQFIIEKMGMMGSLPLPYGYFVQDVIMAAVVGLVTCGCVAPLIPVIGHHLASSSIIQFLLHIIVFALAFSSQFFPYSADAPKRVIFQHTILTADTIQIVDSSYHFAVVDSNSLHFLFKNAPEVTSELSITSDFSFNASNLSQQTNWLAIFPVSSLVSSGLKFPTISDDILKRYKYFPNLSIYKPQTWSNEGSRRVLLELSLGSLEEVWVTVLNITGSLSSWSFADNIVPAPETINGGPASYICRLSGNSHENWTFWLEASSSEVLRVEVAVLDQHLTDGARKLKSLFPKWVDVIAYSSFMSTYIV